MSFPLVWGSTEWVCSAFMHSCLYQCSLSMSTPIYCILLLPTYTVWSLVLMCDPCPCPLLYCISHVFSCFPHVARTECSPLCCMGWLCQHYPVPCTKDEISTPQHWQTRVHHATYGSSRRQIWNGSTSDRWLQFGSNCSYQGVWSDMQAFWDVGVYFPSISPLFLVS